MKKIIAGDSINWVDSFPNFLPYDGWALKARLTPRNPTAAILVIDAVVENDQFKIVANATATATLSAGLYNLVKWVERDDDRHTVEHSTIEVLPNPATMAPGGDTRSHAAKMVDMIQAVLEGRASKSVQEYKIADREMKYIPIPELIVLLDKYKALLAAENRANSVNKGARLGRKIQVRF